MKKTLFFLVLVLPLFSFIDAQIHIDLKDKLLDEINDRANDAVDEVIDKTLDTGEEATKAVVKDEAENLKESDSDKDKDDDAGKEDSDKDKSSSPDKDKSSTKNDQPTLVWSKYDFIPGDKVFFEDIHENEENGEFPSRWDLGDDGTAENAVFGGASVIYFKEAGTCIVPFIENSENDYLPDIFTLEFDAWFEADEYCSYEIRFYDIKNQSESSIDIYPLIIYPNEAILRGKGNGFYPGKEDDEITAGLWRHVALSFNTRALKVYLDDARVINIPNLGINPEGITLCCDDMNTAGIEGKNRFIKNIRIAEGGVKLYDKLLADGKIVSNGIKFDVNKATIKPESMGVMNNICQLMKEHPELKFSVEGHTDSDGDDASNQSLSEKRAKAVVDQLKSMGIDSSRLSSKGWGESKPVAPNNSSEGKAMNRRVEFVKL